MNYFYPFISCGTANIRSPDRLMMNHDDETSHCFEATFMVKVEFQNVGAELKEVALE
jgi:hypothetical protein